MERLYLIFLITISVNQNICLSLNIICCAGSLVHHSDKPFFFSCIHYKPNSWNETQNNGQNKAFLNNNQALKNYITTLYHFLYPSIYLRNILNWITTDYLKKKLKKNTSVLDIPKKKF